MKILFFYPENPLLLSQGNHARALALLHYFKDRNINVDFVSENDNSDTSNLNQRIINEKLVSSHYFIRKFTKKKHLLWYFFCFSLPNKLLSKQRQFNRVRKGQQKDFNRILQNNSYDYIVISYACWAPLIENNRYLKKAKLIIDTHDFLTAQFIGSRDFSLGKSFETEINLLRLFDSVITISNEERYLFSHFIGNKTALITHPLPNNFFKSNTNKVFDIIYIASDNPHNNIGAKWFFDKVYPLLSNAINIVVVGNVTRTIKNYSNVTKIDFTENLDTYYANSKIVICPIFTGTGLKIKVIEALSYGLPVVCNEKGVDGMINKINNGCLVTDNPSEFANYIESLLTDTSYYESITSASKNYFLENNEKTEVYKNIDKLFKK